MSSHLIQPIELFDWDDVSLGLQCIKHGNTTPKWRTVSTLLDFEDNTVLVGAENDDKWAKNTVSKFSSAGVRYATSCLTSATLRFYLPEITSQVGDDIPFPVFFSFILYINEVEITPVNGYILAADVEIGDPAQTVDYIVDLEALGLECRPCGNVWEIIFGIGGGGVASNDIDSTDGQMTMEIVDVTF